MRVLFLGLNYTPEKIGTAIYSTDLCEYLASRGHSVRAVVGKPYYPEWRIYDGYRGGGALRSTEGDVNVTRVAHYVPADPTGKKRLLHHASFAWHALWPMLRHARDLRPDVVVTVAPSLVAAPVAALAARISGAASWLHLQDFEVEAAFATGLVSPDSMLASWARRFERFALRRFDRLSSISPEMCAKAAQLLRVEQDVYLFRNGADVRAVTPLERPSLYRERWGVTTPHVALYSGNIANKQGIEIIVEVAKRLAEREDLTFVVCGQGPNRQNLEAQAEGIDNIRFHDLQPRESLNELMGLATVHLLPQRADAADLVLPSKLTNILASGRPVVATAHSGTGLAREVEGCGVVVPPEEPEAMAAGIRRLLDDPALYQALATAARDRALERWDRISVLDAFEARLLDLVAPGRQAG